MPKRTSGDPEPTARRSAGTSPRRKEGHDAPHRDLPSGAPRHSAEHLLATAQDPQTPSHDPRNRELSSPQERYDARLQRRSSTLLQRRVVEQERASIDEALDQIRTDESIAQAAARIVAARRRFIVGSAKSFSYASLLAFDLGVGLSQVTLVDGTVVRGVDVLADVRSNDLMVAFSFRRYRRDTVEIAQRFVEAGGELVAITDFEDAPLAKLADQCIYVATGSASYVDSPTVVASVLHVLATLTTASAKGARRRLVERDRLNTELGLYVN